MWEGVASLISRRVSLLMPSRSYTHLVDLYVGRVVSSWLITTSFQTHVSTHSTYWSVGNPSLLGFLTF